MTDQWRQWTCAHSETTPEDGEGYAVCVRCGATVTVRLTRAIFDRGVEAIKRRGAW